jgi:hypothetical protein
MILTDQVQYLTHAYLATCFNIRWPIPEPYIYLFYQTTKWPSDTNTLFTSSCRLSLITRLEHVLKGKDVFVLN